jgi:hypothetical protein
MTHHVEPCRGCISRRRILLKHWHFLARRLQLHFSFNDPYLNKWSFSNPDFLLLSLTALHGNLKFDDGALYRNFYGVSEWCIRFVRGTTATLGSS